MPVLRLATLVLAFAPLWPGAPAAQERERCFGVSPAGGNDGLGEEEAPGGAVLDYQGDAWAWTPAGSCLTLPLPPQADGTPRRGAYLPLERDLPPQQ